MRHLLLVCLAALAAVSLLPFTGCVEGSGNGTTDVLTVMAEGPDLAQTRVDTPWVYLMKQDGSFGVPIFDSGAPATGIAQGQLSPDGGSIVYIRFASGAYEICRYDLATRTVTPLHTMGASSGQPTPSWSPDGQTIIFTDGRVISTMDADGGNVAPLLDMGGEASAYNPSYSPDGSKIVLENRATDLVVANADGSNPTAVYTSNYLLHPQWMPDGRIIFADNPAHNSIFDVVVIDADGSNRINLTNTPAIDENHPTCNRAGTFVAWSVGGKTNGDIYVASFTGTAIGTPVNVTADVTMPCWSPTFGRIPTSSVDTVFDPVL